MSSSRLAASIELDALELRFLSVQHVLKWMVALEKTFLKVVSSSKSDACSGDFTIVPSYRRRLFEQCAARFKLEVQTKDNNAMAVRKTKESTAPLLNYFDYIPTPISQSTFEQLVCLTSGDIDIKEDSTMPSSTDLLQWYYRTIDCGFALASHAHLVIATFDGPDGIQELQDYANIPLEIRWVDNKVKDVGVLVMRNVSEATELFEMYEDEESGSEAEYQFTLRPVGSAITAPYIEDTQLRKLRGALWTNVVEQWAQYKCDGLTVVAFNMNEKFTMQDLEKSLDGVDVNSITLVNEGLRNSRRVAYVTLADHTAVKAALDRDGRNLHGKALRIQMMPPTYEYQGNGSSVVAHKYMNRNRPTTPINHLPPPPTPPSNPVTAAMLSSGSMSATTTTTTTTTMSSATVSHAGRSPMWNAQAKEFVPRPSPTSQPLPSPPLVPAMANAPPTAATTTTSTKATTPKWQPNPHTPPFRPRLPGAAK